MWQRQDFKHEQCLCFYVLSCPVRQDSFAICTFLLPFMYSSGEDMNCALPFQIDVCHRAALVSPLPCCAQSAD